MSKPTKRSPLKAPPLRHPGQSLDERRSEILSDKVAFPMIVATFFVILAIVEVAWTFGTSPPLWMHIAAAVCAVIYAVARIRSVLPTLRALRQARDGERVVGQYLDTLRERGYQVFHDIVGTNFNVDHIVIGPGGIYTVETKTWSKPVGQSPKVWFNGEDINVDGTKIDRDPVIQAKAQAKWIRELLAESTGRAFPARAVILFPGWFVEATHGAYKDVWVLNPKALPEFLKNERAQISPEDVKLASYHLSRFIRGAAGKEEK